MHVMQMTGARECENCLGAETVCKTFVHARGFWCCIVKTHVRAHYSAVSQPFICILCWARALRRSHLPYRKCAPSLHIPPFIMLTPAQLLLWNGEKWLSQLFPWASCKYVCAYIFVCALVWGVCAYDEHWLAWFEHDMQDRRFFSTLNNFYLFNRCKFWYLHYWIIHLDTNLYEIFMNHLT